MICHIKLSNLYFKFDNSLISFEEGMILLEKKEIGYGYFFSKICGYTDNEMLLVYKFINKIGRDRSLLDIIRYYHFNVRN